MKKLEQGIDMSHEKFLELSKILKYGRPGGMRLSKYQKLEKEFRLIAPKCNPKRECSSCENKNICWDC